ncbi:TetR/AcrR family transcriptional regulator [Mycobacterium sp. IS-3022]|uniref:TetR/AcrR family transcriptional regulator n=1 Tax=Mycobacterium sp. IS-3022 TaxID=1772277 RepID=UPI000A75BFF0|nr:TetR/AcrR family transcriptional regulator [Mycobacterium sp. IS-3022]
MVTRRPGGRSERVRVKVLEAAVERLLVDGYDGLKVRDVARLADVAETTIYRRWPTTHDLAAAALGHLARTDNPIPDTGTLEGDLRTLLGQILNLLRRPEVERILRVAAALDSRDPGAVDARKAFWRSRFLGSSRIVERAIDRGELPVGTDPDELIEFLVGPAYLRRLLLDRPLDSALLDLSVHNTLAAYAVGRQNP